MDGARTRRGRGVFPSGLTGGPERRPSAVSSVSMKRGKRSSTWDEDQVEKELGDANGTFPNYFLVLFKT